MTNPSDDSVHLRLPHWTRIVSLVIACGALISIAGSFTSYDLLRGFLDRYSGDGSADAYTPGVHDRITTFLLFTGVIGGLLAATVWWLPKSLWDRVEIRGRTRRTIEDWFAITSENALLLSLFFLCAVLFRIPFLNDPIRFDEAYTYLNYARPPVFIGLSTYHDPNNHVFNTLLIHLSTSLFGYDPWAIRLPAFLAGCLCMFFTYLVGVTFGNKSCGILAALIVCLSSALIEYSALGRGYTMVVLFTLLEIIVAGQILKSSFNSSSANSTGQDELKTPQIVPLNAKESSQGSDSPNGLEWPLMVVFSSLGLWTIPSMAYANAMVWTWLLITGVISEPQVGRRRFIICWMTGVASVALLTIALYSPIIATSGLKSLTGNDFVKPLTRDQFLKGIIPGIETTASLLLRDWNFVAWAVIVIGWVMAVVETILLTLHKKPLFPVPFACSVLSVALLLLVQHVIPPARTWLFLIPICALICGWGWSSTLDKIRSQSLKSKVSGVAFAALVATQIPFSTTSESIRQSDETGRCPDAERVVQRLLEMPISESQDAANFPIVTTTPISSPLVFHAQRSGLDEQHFAIPTQETIHYAIVLVSREHGQSPEAVLRSLGTNTPIDWSHEEQPNFTLIDQIGEVEIYQIDPPTLAE
ncbi:hypothetical protein KOR42_28160 [Thalassoglobus neptunius]|uniref:Uncharacterized protein n=1 Tax=Thalassoglobus neptunius TaxID=1938619 RepID=A0A5C5WXX9_9PLAN|nr:glycosyltransferase family 39 protein [Thalassoglobus neptunius]TWT55430.1 hypothetical protein KOR42_28160 [Thalassoglobus neptunius]